MCAIVARVRIGVFVSETSADQTGVDALLASAAGADADGFATAWVPHIPWSFDALSALTMAAAVTSRIELGTAVVPTYSRHPLSMAQQALSTQAVARGRATLGIGPSHPVVVEGMYGLSYEHPIRHVREYVDVLDAAFAGSGQVDHDGELYRVHAMLRVPDADSMPILLAALAPLMLRLAGERTEGTITWMADERAHAEHVVPRLTAAAESAGRPAPRVVAGLPIAVHDDADAARERAAKLFAVYTQIPTYQRILDRGDASGPPEVCIVGDEAAVTARLRSYRDAGVTDLAATIFGVGDDRVASRRRTWELLASLAPEL
jgi:F420-dependent oxidoreductase-like protein